MELESFIIGILFTLCVILFWEFPKTRQLISFDKLFHREQKNERKGCPECGSLARHKRGCSYSKEKKKDG